MGNNGKHAFSFMLPPACSKSNLGDFSSVRVVMEASMETISPIIPDFKREIKWLKAGSIVR